MIPEPKEIIEMLQGTAIGPLAGLLLNAVRLPSIALWMKHISSYPG